ncbi:MAG: 50S ribosomal protein L17 [Candidatus Taylorbacteria bacterium RIFCSPHIGHO2_02_FULL_47_18]|uniref:50S ribosomal protein L17 n=1 Tax=Candidatus Taylorbacteria bacterium RIFCSPLOWO2_01_FULL_48_100 TaxID=1802322 RepID=A0A1G2NDB1_9BACT|nr:MAG: 50S ribosomal protein L17 [Candidatus Taylorbacteria bacterium RIFCSPHIGHO2_01_FULL_48_38]OHA28000.1 MAG: 50S ribosomal protein L17 [Candidatus Taylorbacteria bacterium RIFCSPHIGHO2_02_FULL_47_18]OHA34040.1 MAG: 50S ribosomal protein L17 [Candidatus Taylorbacteria bacterium RIFCSPLOWO2_01_FULL_48_100]OHA40070.1 MAG: 50S ribosomal protein L17 [Candidatus Taylorbacteria bacterium RIFCSPLOWO2_02_FULL_48_16]OHA45163.1 MAG: 50S ribosomal protein L17 [Candidatus Taylorbacteria bacterium RIFCS
MRHSNRNKKFGRKRKVRVALMRSLARSLVLRGKIETTEARAKALRPFIERMVTGARAGTVAARRLAARRMGSVDGADLLFKNTVKKYEKRAGGYTRITKVGFRKSDGAKKAIIEFV